MTDLLLKIFVKDYENSEDPATRKRCGTLASVVGIAVNFLLAAIKLVAGLLSASVAIIADAVNNMSDAGSSAITLVSFKLSAKPADKDHPFGHARIEYIASMIVSFIILLVGAELLISSGETLLGLSEEKSTEISTLTLIILGVSVLMKFWLGLFYNSVGKRINSTVIKASATDSFSDSLSTLGVLASSIVIKLTDLQILDAIVGIVISVIVLIAGIKILNETKNALLGEAPVDELVDALSNIVADYDDIIGMHDLLVHNYGPGRFVASFHAEVDGKGDIFALHDTIDNVERRINEELGITCTIHMDPIVTDDETVNALKAMLTEVMTEQGLKLNVHDFRVVVGNTHTNLIFDVVLPFEHPSNEQEIKDTICRAVAEKQSNCYCVITVDRG